jgi:hypothetical protein
LGDGATFVGIDDVILGDGATVVGIAEVEVDFIFRFHLANANAAPTKAEATPTTDAILSIMVHALVSGLPMVGLMVGILVVVEEGVFSETVPALGQQDIS